ncbi:hypothetical protein BDI4_830014 [Burkholderia diffusa]|nr:hypothetical protein BDI4_830014 [Burkholderia diffusa]
MDCEREESRPVFDRAVSEADVCGVWQRRADFRGSKWRPADGILDAYLKPTYWLPN